MVNNVWNTPFASFANTLARQRPWGTHCGVRHGSLSQLEMTPEVNIFDALGTIVGGIMDVCLHPEFDSNAMVYITYLNEQNLMSVARFDFSNRQVDDLGRVRDVDQLPSGDLIVVVEAPLSAPPNGEIIRLSPALG